MSTTTWTKASVALQADEITAAARDLEHATPVEIVRWAADRVGSDITVTCSFEDVVVFDECVEKHFPNWTKIFDEYQNLRKPNADAIADLAVQNYYEMAEKVGDKHFLHKKHIEHDLSDLYPDQFKSQYELTTFSLSPYSYALSQGKKNDVLLEKIIADNAEEKIKDSAYMDSLWHLIA